MDGDQLLGLSPIHSPIKPLAPKLTLLLGRAFCWRGIADPTKGCNHHRRIVAVCYPELGEFIQ
jgi:hypothetical protein